MVVKKKTIRNKILILGAGVYGRPFREFGECLLSSDQATTSDFNWETIKTVVFTGGEDVHPEMYEEKKHPKTFSNIFRDKREQVFFNMCKNMGIPMVGICRGAQFLNVMNGGRLMQNVHNHAIEGTHSIITREDKQVEVTSTHHQMMYPHGKYELLAWAEGLSHKYETGRGSIFPKKGKDAEPFSEPEAVYFPSSKSLAVQFHPEYMNKDTGGYVYFQDLLKEFIYAS